MNLLHNPGQSEVVLKLSRNLVRSIKRGHCWVYADSLRNLPQAEPGVPAILLDNRGGREIGRGIYDPDGKIALRICTTKPGEVLDNYWATSTMQRSINNRLNSFSHKTNAYRLFNGEGDKLPGLICDRYGNTAVISLDGEASDKFWNVVEIGKWLSKQLELIFILYRRNDRRSTDRKVLFGKQPEGNITFRENGYTFTVDPIHGQKTGFYLDQRDNRRRIQKYTFGKTVLNCFGYTGGFSVYAGYAGARNVTTVVTAQPALDTAQLHWSLNNLDPDIHKTVRADAFEFLESAKKGKKKWDVVILDPPSFAPSKKSLPIALNAYKKLIAAGASVTKSDGILAAGSCSSHVNLEDFLTACENGISMVRKQATILGIYTQPDDHPVPLAMPEFNYLKFIIMRIAD